MARVLLHLRRQRLRFIERNPIVITLNRVTRTLDDVTGGRLNTETVVGPYRVRLTNLRVDVALAGAQTNIPGQYSFENRYALVCPYFVDIQFGGNIQDYVDLVNYGNFFVREVSRETFEGDIYGVTAHLELRR